MEQATQAAEQAAARTAARIAAARFATAAGLFGTAARLSGTGRFFGTAARLSGTAALFAAAVVVAMEQATQTAEQAAARASARIAAARLTAVSRLTASRLATAMTTTQQAAKRRSALGAAEHHRDAQDKRRNSNTSVHREAPNRNENGRGNTRGSAGKQTRHERTHTWQVPIACGVGSPLCLRTTLETSSKGIVYSISLALLTGRICQNERKVRPARPNYAGSDAWPGEGGDKLLRRLQYELRE